MNNIKLFENPEFGSIRTISKDNEPWFVGKDVADILKYRNGSRDVNRHVDREDRSKMMISDGNQMKETIIINESGLYSLVLSSKLPNARQFKRWITSEVIPSIRQHGGYLAGQEDMTPEELLSKALLYANSKIEQMNKQIEEMKPKAVFADAVSVAKTSILVGDLAKILKQNGIETGQKRLFQWLRDNGYLIKGGNSKNMPTQRAMEKGLFEIKESTMANPDGSIRINKTVKVTGVGQQYFINKFLAVKGE